MKERRFPLGVDLGESRVRVAALRQRGDVLELLGVGAADVDGDGHTSLLAALKQLDVRESRAVAMIRSCDATLRVVTLPVLARRDLHRAARFEGLASFGNDEPVAVRSLILKGDAGKPKMIVAATRTRTVKAVLGTLNAAGLRPVRIDHEACVLARNSRAPLIDVGLNRTSILVPASPVPIVRTVPLGGAFFTQAIAEELGTTLAIAEVRKRTIGLGGAASSAVTEFCRRVGEQIDEIVEREGMHVSDVCLCGNGARLEAVSTALRERFGVGTGALQLPAAVEAGVPREALNAAAADWYGAVAASVPVAEGTAMVA